MRDELDEDDDDAFLLIKTGVWGAKAEAMGIKVARAAIEKTVAMAEHRHAGDDEVEKRIVE